MDTLFTVVRHGQTAENLAGILQGWLDTPLDDLGRRQARAVAERLATEHFDLLFTSDLRRACETAQIIGEQLEINPVLLPDLREWHLGELEGRPCTELRREYPEIMNSFLVDCIADIPVPGGESRNAFFARIAKCLDGLAEAHPGRKLLLITHGGVLRAIHRHVVGPVAPGCLLPQTTNAGLTRFSNRNGRWQLTGWNECSHLADTGCRESVTF